MDKKYEAVFIIKPKLDKNILNDTIDRINNIILSEDGEIYFKEKEGTKKLAYEIKGYKEGYYYYIKFKVDSSKTNKIGHISVKINTIEEIIKHIIVRLEN